MFEFRKVISVSHKFCYFYRGQKPLCSVDFILEPGISTHQYANKEEEPAEPPTFSAVWQSTWSADQSGYEII